MSTLGSEALPAVSKIIDEDKLAEFVQVRVVGPPLVCLSELVHKVDQIGVTRNHERAHHNLFPAALNSLIKRLVDNSGIEAE